MTANCSTVPLELVSGVNNGRTRCARWTAFEQTIKQGVVVFLVDLMERKLHWRDHLEEAAREMQLEHSGDKVQGLRAEIDLRLLKLGIRES